MNEKITQLKLVLKFHMYKMKISHKLIIKYAILTLVILVIFALSFHSVYLAMELNPDNTWYSTNVYTKVFTIFIFIFLSAAFRIFKIWPAALIILIIIALQSQTIVTNDLKATVENRIFGVITLDSVHLCGQGTADSIFSPSIAQNGDFNILKYLNNLNTTDNGCEIQKSLYYIRIPYLVSFYEIDRKLGYRAISKWFDRYVFKVGA